MRCPGGHPVVAATLDFAMRPLDPLRDKVVPQARGRVLEVGVGTGLNLDRYNAAGITELVGLEPDPHMLRRARPRFAAAPMPARLVHAGAEAMPFDDAHFDELVVTFVMCTIPDVAAGMREMQRVLRPGGVLRFVEHTHSDHGPMRWVQGTLDPLWGHFAGGCHLNRDPVALLTTAGFELTELHPHGRGPWNLTPMQRGIARRA